MLVSGLTGEGLQELLHRIDAAIPTDPLMALSLRIPLAEGRILAMIHALGRVLRSDVDASHMNMDAKVPASIVQKFHLQKFTVRGTSRPRRS